jgi:hypothetical protein
LGNNIAKESISTGAEEARVFSTLAADKRLAAGERSKGFWAPYVNERHFSTLHADGGSDLLLLCPHHLRVAICSR